jgi:hypothetical protein
MSGYYTFTTADNGKVLGFPLLQSSGNSNNFSGATASLQVRDQNGNLNTRPLVWNPTTVEWGALANCGRVRGRPLLGDGGGDLSGAGRPDLFQRVYLRCH